MNSFSCMSYSRQKSRPLRGLSFLHSTGRTRLLAPTALRSQASLVPRSPQLLRAAHPPRSLSSLTGGQDGPEPEGVVAARRVEVVAAVRRPAVERAAAPTAAPNHAARA